MRCTIWKFLYINSIILIFHKIRYLYSFKNVFRRIIYTGIRTCNTSLERNFELIHWFILFIYNCLLRWHKPISHSLICVYSLTPDVNVVCWKRTQIFMSKNEADVYKQQTMLGDLLGLLPRMMFTIFLWFNIFFTNMGHVLNCVLHISNAGKIQGAIKCWD